MNDLNSVNLVGRLVRDPELKYSQGGYAILSMSIAVNRSIKRGDQWQEMVSYFDVIVYGKMAENQNQYLHKGKQIGLIGRLDQQRWTGQDGQNHSKVVIIAEQIERFGGNDQKQNNSYQQPAQQSAQNYQQPDNYDGYDSSDFPEEIPF